MPANKVKLANISRRRQLNRNLLFAFLGEMSASEVFENEEKSVQIKTESQRRGSDNTRGAGKEEKTADTAGNKAVLWLSASLQVPDFQHLWDVF